MEVLHEKNIRDHQGIKFDFHRLQEDGKRRDDCEVFAH